MTTAISAKVWLRPRERGYCEVLLNDEWCAFPAGLADEDERHPMVRTRCYRCGLRACKNCSDVKLTHAPQNTRIRICRDCQEDEL